MKNKLVRAGVSAVLAFVLWLFVVTVYRTETERTFNVPVIFDGESVLEDRGLMIVGNKDLMIRLKLNGNRSELNKLRGSDIIVMVDLTRIYEPGEKSLEYSISFPGDIRNGAIEVVNRDPSYITLQVAQFDSKEVPLEVVVTGTPAPEHEVNYAGITINGSSTGVVRIGGPKKIIDQVSTAKVFVDVTGAAGSGTYASAVKLCDAEGNPLEGDLSNVAVSNHHPTVVVPLLKQKSVNLVGTVTAGNGLTGEDVDLKLSFGQILVAGTDVALKNVPDTIEVKTFDLSQVTQNQMVQSFDIELSAYPGVRISATESEEARSGKVVATLNLPEKVQKKIDIVLTKNHVINVPPNRTVTFSGSETATIQITLEGWAPVLNRISQEDIRAEIDVKDGINKIYYVKVTLEGDFQSGVQVVGTYQVSIILKIGT
jgi:hypothetical protein